MSRNVSSPARVITTTITRPANTTAYGANDALSDDASSPQAGGFTFPSASRLQGGGGIITGLNVISTNDPATLLIGECWVFDDSVTNINDNAAFSLSDTDAVKLIAVIPFTMLSSEAGSGSNSYSIENDLSHVFKCVENDLHFLVKVKNAYTPASAEELTFRLMVLQN